jgi:hypothetical protein
MTVSLGFASGTCCDVGLRHILRVPPRITGPPVIKRHPQPRHELWSKARGDLSVSTGVGLIFSVSATPCQKNMR